jgi:ParB/RepB/Spo0J family partition protein
MNEVPETLLVPIVDILARECYRTPNDASIGELMESMRLHGQREPGTAHREGMKYRIRTGMRRLEALHRTNATHMWLTILPHEASIADCLEDCLISDTHRKSLSGMQLAQYLKESKEQRGCTVRALCERLGYSDPTISRLRQLNVLPEEVQERVRTGEICASVGYEIAKAQGTEQQIALADVAVRERLTREQIRNRVNNVHTNGTRRGRKPIPRIELDRGNGNSITFQGREFQSLEAVVAALGETLDVMTEALAAGLDLATFREAFKAARQAG